MTWNKYLFLKLVVITLIICTGVIISSRSLTIVSSSTTLAEKSRHPHTTNTFSTIKSESTKRVTENYNASSHFRFNDSVTKELKDVIRQWTDSEIEIDKSSKTIRRLWVEDGKRPNEYYPQGANDLILKVEENTFFLKCRPEPKLKLRWFKDGDQVQTVGDLWNKLSRCNN